LTLKEKTEINQRKQQSIEHKEYLADRKLCNVVRKAARTDKGEWLCIGLCTRTMPSNRN